MTTFTGLVAYTDGSSMPATCHYGMGAHGYVYHYPDEGKKATRVNAYVATDIGYVLEKDLGHTDAKPVIVQQYFDISVPGEGRGTNNIAEVLAPVMVFEQLPTELLDVERVHIVGDSEYMLNGSSKWI